MENEYNPQIPFPEIPGDVTQPVAGVNMHEAYVRSIGCMAYIWGWPMVNQINRCKPHFTMPGQCNRMHVAPLGHIVMHHDYIDPHENFVTCPNQDVLYGLGYFSLDMEPAVIQVPDFGDRFWLYAMYDARSDQFASIGKQHYTKPGFYLIAGPNWNGSIPGNITATVRSSTALANVIPRVFMNNTKEDRELIQQVINKIVAYPLSRFDGKMKVTDWKNKNIPDIPESSDNGETQWVIPGNFFNNDQLGLVLNTVPPLPGEEALYSQFRLLLSAANDSYVRDVLDSVAKETEEKVIKPFFKWKNNGVSAGNGWNRSANGARFGVDYFNRTGTAKSNMFENIPEETQYFYTDNDTAGNQLHGKNNYIIKFHEVPPVNGFWSITLYNSKHLLELNDLGQYSLGTKNKLLHYDENGSLTIYAGVNSPGEELNSNWLPAPDDRFSLFIRAYWGRQEILDGTWEPPVIKKMI